jgi:hypothetical protein
VSTQTDDPRDVEPELLDQIPIPSIVTNSALEIMRHFTDDILELEATASTGTANRDDLIPEIGLDRTQSQRQEVTLNYRRIPCADGPGAQNPLTDDAIDNIEHQLRRKLDDFNTDVEPDLAVQRVVVDAELPELAEVTRATTNEYELTFVSDPVEADPSTDEGPEWVTRQRNRGKGLYDELGFNLRNLNLHAVEETRIKYAEQGNPRIMGWGGPKDIRPNSDNKLTEVIVDEVVPSEFAFIKWYRVTSEDTLELTGMTGGGQ